MTMPPGGVPQPIDDETLSAYLDGTLADAEAATVAAALRRDPALAVRARETEATVALLRALPQPAPRRTFVLTPEMAAPFRPARAARSGWLSRLVPAMTAASAVAAVLLLALFIGDLRTDGFRAPDDAARMSTRAVNEAAADAATVAATRPAATVAASGALPPTSAPAATTAAARPPVSAALPAPTLTSGSAVTAAGAAATVAITLPTTIPPAVPTAVANVRATAATAANPPAGGAALQPVQGRRVPLALVRAGEVALLILFVIALGLAVAGLRARYRT